MDTSYKIYNQEYNLLTQSQVHAKITRLIAKYVDGLKAHHPYIQYYYVKGNYHINNIEGFTTAADICHWATGLEFRTFTNSIAKLAPIKQNYSFII